MNKPGTSHWKSRSWRKLVSGLWIGFGVFLMVITEFLFPHFSKSGFYLGLCFIGAGLIKLTFRSILKL